VSGVHVSGAAEWQARSGQASFSGNVWPHLVRARGGPCGTGRK
jgi:hypothetical protein